MRSFLLLLLLTTSSVVTAQKDSLAKDTSLWKKGCLVGVTFTQVSLNNWAAGGQNSMAINSMVNLFANFKNKYISFDNSLDMGYGIINQAKLPWWEKADDKIDASSKFGQKANDTYWYFSLLFNFKSQFMPGFDKTAIPMSQRKVISNFMAPGYFILALGVDYKPNDNFSLLIAPITGKMTVVNSPSLADAGAFGVDKAKTDATGAPIPGTGSRTRTELGSYVKFMYKFTLMKNITVASKLDLFSNYLNNPENIDVNWDVLINMKINRFISATLNTVLLYDHDINIARDPDEFGVNQRNGPVTQFKEVFSIGFNYKFAK
ncbi:MAG TPA: DUF3078 domain-containing protein [Flavobacteriales bacterium]|nr:DUF3078 domain-containing protein [Flavobacteriales bacterium]